MTVDQAIELLKEHSEDGRGEDKLTICCPSYTDWRLGGIDSLLAMPNGEVRLINSSSRNATTICSKSEHLTKARIDSL